MGIIFANFALLLGPLLYRFVKDNKALLELIDGFIFISIGGLVLQHLLPEALGENGVWIVVIAALGFLGPNLLESKLSSFGQSVHKGVLFFGILGLCLHETLDGAALVKASSSELNAAIIIHRIPVGLTIWCLLRPHFGAIAASTCLALMVLMTCAGYLWFESFQEIHSTIWLEFVQAAAAGAVLHVVVFRFHLDQHFKEEKTHSCCSHNHNHSHEKIEIGSKINLGKLSLLAEGLGNLLGFALLILMTFFSIEQHSDFWARYLTIFSESSYALFLGYLIGGSLLALAPKLSLAWFRTGGDFIQALKGLVFGLPLAVCSCGVLPIYESLARRKIPIVAGFAFLIATPELGIDAVLLSFPLLGMDITILRVLAVIVFTFSVSLISANFAPKQSKPLYVDNEEENSDSGFFKTFYDGTFKLLENTGSWILLGILIAVLAERLIDRNFLLSFAGWDVLIFAIVGVFVYVCAAGSTPLVAVLISNGLSIGAGIAFLLTGPATNVSTFGVISRLYSKKLAWAFCITAYISAVLIGFFINLTLSDLKIPTVLSQEHHHADVGLFFPLAVALLIVLTILKIGARKFFSQIVGKIQAATN